AAGDLDDDSVSELLAVSRTGNVLAEVNFRGGSFITKTVSIAGGPAGLAAGDVNGDGLLDAVVATADGKLETLVGTGGQLVQYGSNVTGDPFGPPATLQLGG